MSEVVYQQVICRTASHCKSTFPLSNIFWLFEIMFGFVVFFGFGFRFFPYWNFPHYWFVVAVLMNWNLEGVEELGIILKASYFLAQKKNNNKSLNVFNSRSYFLTIILTNFLKWTHDVINTFILWSKINEIIDNWVVQVSTTLNLIPKHIKVASSWIRECSWTWVVMMHQKLWHPCSNNL